MYKVLLFKFRRHLCKVSTSLLLKKTKTALQGVRLLSIPRYKIINSAKNFPNILTAKLKCIAASVYRRSTSFHVQILQQDTSVFTLCFQWFL